MSSQRRLIIVDDEADFGTLVVEVATELGYAASAATNAGDFRKLYEAQIPDTVVLDMVMPGQDGIELIQWLVLQGYRSRIIIISGYHPDYARSAKALAEVAGTLQVLVLQKPISLEKLRANLR
jgi:CheY-like chemotaxis protein